MYLIRDIFHCKPGKVRAMVDKFKKMNELGKGSGMPQMRILTDFSAERYWTIVSEMEVADLKAYEDMMSSQPNAQLTAEDMTKFEEVMTGYHDLVPDGRREIFKIES
jgi:hypothetical protein